MGIQKQRYDPGDDLYFLSPKKYPSTTLNLVRSITPEHALHRVAFGIVDLMYFAVDRMPHEKDSNLSHVMQNMQSLYTIILHANTSNWFTIPHVISRDNTREFIAWVKHNADTAFEPYKSTHASQVEQFYDGLGRLSQFYDKVKEGGMEGLLTQEDKVADMLKQGNRNLRVSLNRNVIVGDRIHNGNFHVPAIYIGYSASPPLLITDSEHRSLDAAHRQFTYLSELFDNPEQRTVQDITDMGIRMDNVAGVRYEDWGVNFYPHGQKPIWLPYNASAQDTGRDKLKEWFTAFKDAGSVARQFHEGETLENLERLIALIANDILTRIERPRVKTIQAGDQAA